MLSKLGCVQLLLPARHAAPASAPRQNAEQPVRLFLAPEGAAPAQRMTRLVKTLTSDRGAEEDVLARIFEKICLCFLHCKEQMYIYMVGLRARSLSRMPLAFQA